MPVSQRENVPTVVATEPSREMRCEQAVHPQQPTKPVAASDGPVSLSHASRIPHEKKIIGVCCRRICHCNKAG
jgi:hypothetical protein